MEKVRIGQITAPVGIKGEIRVFPYTDRESRFSDIKEVYVGEGETRYTIQKVRYDKGLVVLKFNEVNDRNTSETLRGVNLYVDKEQYVLDDDSYFVDELIGCSVFSEEGEMLGILDDVNQNSPQDIYVVETPEGKTFMIPAVKEFIKNVDTAGKTVTVHVIDGLIG